jgi:hypothetical protein
MGDTEARIGTSRRVAVRPALVGTFTVTWLSVALLAVGTPAGALSGCSDCPPPPPPSPSEFTQLANDLLGHFPPTPCARCFSPR